MLVKHSQTLQKLVGDQLHLLNGDGSVGPHVLVQTLDFGRALLQIFNYEVCMLLVAIQIVNPREEKKLVLIFLFVERVLGNLDVHNHLYLPLQALEALRGWRVAEHASCLSKVFQTQGAEQFAAVGLALRLAVLHGDHASVAEGKPSHNQLPRRVHFPQLVLALEVFDALDLYGAAECARERRKQTSEDVPCLRVGGVLAGPTGAAGTQIAHFSFEINIKSLVEVHGDFGPQLLYAKHVLGGEQVDLRPHVLKPLNLQSCLFQVCLQHVSTTSHFVNFAENHLAGLSIVLQFLEHFHVAVPEARLRIHQHEDHVESHCVGQVPAHQLFELVFHFDRCVGVPIPGRVDDQPPPHIVNVFFLPELGLLLAKEKVEALGLA